MSAAEIRDDDPYALLYTWQDYLRFEATAEERHEYHPVTTQSAGGAVLGRLVAMAGATWDHGLISNNVAREIGNLLRDRDCFVIGPDMKVRNPSGHCYYPDVVIVCGEPEFEEREDKKSPLVLLNPTVLIEVLSETTAAYDRGEKFVAYRSIESLREYILIPPDGQPVDRFLRADRSWKFEPSPRTDAAFPIESLDIEVSMAETFRGVKTDDASR